MDAVEPSDVTFGPEHVWLDRAGKFICRQASSPACLSSARLLALLIGEVRRDGSARVPGGLVLVTARATGQLDAAPIVSAARWRRRSCVSSQRIHMRRCGPFSRQWRPPTQERTPLWSLTKKCWLLTPRPPTAAPDYDYQEAIAATPTLRPEPTIRSFIDRSPLRPAAAAALAAAAFAAGAAVALQSSRRPAAPATNMTEVIISPRADTGPRLVDPAPRRADRSRSSESFEAAYSRRAAS